jgi:glycerol-3-phosphate O-acyltransferase/dihydroxyacetone phosphate acyltransferase
VSAVAASDCESLDGGFLEQDVNAWSSLAYVAAAAFLLLAVVRGRLRRPVLVLAAAVAAEGVGSVLYHGSPGAGAKWVHDVALLALLAYPAGWHVARAAGRTPAGADRVAVAAAAAATLVSAALLAAVPDASVPLTGVGLAVVTVAELVARRRGAGALGAAFVALVAAGGLLWWAGRTGGPLCEPRSLLQLHGAWHLVTALATVLWADRTSGVPADGRARLFRDVSDRLLGLAAIALVRGFHRSIDVVDRDRLPEDRPVLLIVNHGNGFVDPVVVAAALGRLPRFLAKAALWKVVPARPLLDAAGILPVHRTADGDRSEGNQDTFAACHRELARRGTVAIFPEGTTGDRAALDRLRSGAARIALGALPGAPDLVVVPIGLAFESRVETRTRAVVCVGSPFTVAEGPWVGEADERAAAALLTAHLTAVLADVSPQYASVAERDGLREVARVALQAEADPGHPPSFGEVERLARRLAAAPVEARSAAIDAMAHHTLRCRIAGLDDAALVPGGPLRSLGSLLPVLVLLAVAWPLVLATLLVHLPLLLAVRAATTAVRSTATKGTVRLLIGAAGAVLTWTVVGVLVADGWGVPVAMLVVAALGALALASWSRSTRAVLALWDHLRLRDRRQLADALFDSRAALLDLVRRVTAP